MIIISGLGPADKGREVIYTYDDEMKKETGHISSWNGKYIFVRFSSGGTPAACYPRNLQFAQSNY